MAERSDAVGTITGLVTAIAFLAFVVDIFTEGGIRRAIRNRLMAEPEVVSSVARDEVFGVASGAEAILKRGGEDEG